MQFPFDNCHSPFSSTTFFEIGVYDRPSHSGYQTIIMSSQPERRRSLRIIESRRKILLDAIRDIVHEYKHAQRRQRWRDAIWDIIQQKLAKHARFKRMVRKIAEQRRAQKAAELRARTNLLANHRIEDEDVTVTSHFLAKCRMSEVVPGCISSQSNALVSKCTHEWFYPMTNKNSLTAMLVFMFPATIWRSHDEIFLWY